MKNYFAILIILGANMVHAQSKKEQITILQQKMDSLSSVLITTQSQLENSQRQLKEKEDHAINLGNKLENSKTENAITKDSLLSCNTQKNELNKSIDAKNKQIKDKEIECEGLKSKLRHVNDSLATSKEDNRNLKGQIEALKTEGNSLKLKLDMQTSDLLKTQNLSDYKVSEFYDEYGWYFCSLVSNSNITLLCYANKNQYHKSGKPQYILQGTIGAPNQENAHGDGDPTAGAVNFKTIYFEKGYEEIGPIWYKVNKGGKDQLEMEGAEATISIYVAK
jgi:hypothetical protein